MLIPAADGPVVTTPNGTMTTCAAPSLGSTELAVWRVEMAPESAGPDHVVHAEQVWVVLDGSLDIDLDGHRHHAAVGDTVIIPAESPRRLHAPEGVTCLVTAPAGVTVSIDGRPAQALPWAT